MPRIGIVNSALELEPCTDANRPRGSIITDEGPSSSKNPKRSRQSVSEDSFLPNLIAKEGTALRLTEFPIRNYPEGSTPAAITQHSLDSTYVLDTLIASYPEYVYIHFQFLFSIYKECSEGEGLRINE